MGFIFTFLTNIQFLSKRVVKAQDWLQLNADAPVVQYT